jgi:hypothetical protein
VQTRQPTPFGFDVLSPLSSHTTAREPDRQTVRKEANPKNRDDRHPQAQALRRSYHGVMQPDFLLKDQGDGWWHCPSPLECFILDGPALVPDVGGEFWLVRTEPAIEWNGDPNLGDRWGPNHPLAHPFQPTNLALVMAASPSGCTDLTGDSSIPTYPVLGDASTVETSNWIAALAAMASLVPVK